MQLTAADANIHSRPSDRAGPTVLSLSAHASPTAPLGAGDGGGLSVYLHHATRALRERGVRVLMFTAHPVDRPHPDDHVISLAPERTEAQAMPAWVDRILDHPATADVQLVHAHYWTSAWAGILLSRRLHVPLITTLHTVARLHHKRRPAGTAAPPRARSLVEALLGDHAAARIASSRAEAAVTPGGATVIPPGVHPAPLSPGSGSDSVELLWAGRFCVAKDPLLALEVLAALPSRFRLTMYGDTTDRHLTKARLRGRAADLGVDDRVTLAGARPHASLLRRLQRTDVVLVTSNTETFGMFALEAQAAGVPVVAPARDGLTDSVKGGVLTPRTVDALAAGVHDAHRRREELALLGRAHADALTWERHASTITLLYARSRDRTHDAVSSA